jgi:stage IV sporulation protein B
MLNLFAITVFYIKYCKSQLPNTIHIKKGEKISLCYNIPASATINNQKIKLNRTFIFQKCSSGQYEMKTSLFGAIPLKKIKLMDRKLSRVDRLSEFMLKQMDF